MDSLVKLRPDDSIYHCATGVGYIEGETEITSSGKTTYFRRFDFNKEDFSKWHEWYDKRRRNIKEKIIENT